jgi:hypothetical protein
MSKKIFETCDKVAQHGFSVPRKIKECHVGEDEIITPEIKNFEYVWRVIKNNKFTFPVARTPLHKKATDFYGKEVWIERTSRNKPT